MPMPFAEYHRPMTVGCCFRVNHMPAMATAGQPRSLGAVTAHTECGIGYGLKHAYAVSWVFRKKENLHT